MAARGELVIYPANLGVAIDDEGNPCVLAVDPGGLAVTVVVNPQFWKAFLSAAQRLRGVGIAGLAIERTAEVVDTSGNGG
jgi:hypothetical protein